MIRNLQAVNFSKKLILSVSSLVVFGGICFSSSYAKSELKSSTNTKLKEESLTQKGLPDRPSTFYLTPDRLYKAGEIRLGEARLYPVWGVSYDANIPKNRKTWAIAMAHAHQIFRNVLCWAEYPMSGWFATPLKESACGCDPNIENDSSLPFPIKYYVQDDRDGCYQIEGYNSAYAELSRLYPDRFPSGTHDKYIAKDAFETSAIAKAYYDIGAFRFMEVGKGYKIYEFLNEAKDPLAPVKLISAAYNRGWWSEVLNNILVKKRSESIKSDDILDFFGTESVAKDHAAQISQYVLVMTDQAYKLKPELIAVNPETREPYNYFKGYYDEPIEWADIVSYLDKISPLYSKVNMNMVKEKAKKVFDSKNNGSSISFRYDLGDILDEIMLNLPVDDPTKGIISNYGSQFPSDGQIPNCKQSTTGIDPIIPATSFIFEGIYPNPAKDNVEVKFSLPKSTNLSYEICDSQGRLLDSKEDLRLGEGKQIIKLSLNEYIPGVYVFKLKAGNSSANRKIVITK
ncbi:MAG: T9SS type A sorting domain-containing protein [Bacteroidales bacterium]